MHHYQKASWCLILLFFILSCNPFQISDLYPIVGLYDGKIIKCNNEQIKLNPNDSTSLQIYQRDVIISSYNDFSNKDDIDENLLCLNEGEKISGKKKRTLVIETIWYCINPDTEPKCDTIGALFAVAVELKKNKDGKNDFELLGGNIQDVDKSQNCNLPCNLYIEKMKGFYSNGAIQVEYTLTNGGTDSFSYTMIAQKR